MMLLYEPRQDRKVATVVAVSRCLGHLAITLRFCLLEVILSYQSLARKYRPVLFQDMVGQESVTTALLNAVKLKRVPQGVIFSGVRGVGKTTLARLFAKSLNCEFLSSSAEPCGSCESCLAIASGSHEDVLEIDGASNTSVDHVRDLQESVTYVPQRSKFKIYTIDEVHMLSQSAFNALLKTLEEPPEHVVFVFATTELHKVPETIISRCQTFYLRKIPSSVIVDRLKTILNSEGVRYEDLAVTLVARQGHGSLRDALTFLDQVIAMGNGVVSVKVVQDITRSVSSVEYIQFLQLFTEKNATELIALIDRWERIGAPITSIVEECARFCRHGFILRELESSDADTKLVELSQAEIIEIRNLAKKSSLLDLNRGFRTLVRCRKDLQGSEMDRYIFENYLLEWCLDPGLPTVNDLKRMEAIPNQPVKSSVPTTSTASHIQSPKSDRPLTSRWNKVRSPEVAELPKIDDPVTQEMPLSVDALKKEPQHSEEGVSPLRTDNRDSECHQPMSFPQSWKQLVAHWMKYAPLQGRVLEETFALVFSQEEIRIGVPEGSMVAAKLLNPESRKKILRGLQHWFSFQGQLFVEEQKTSKKVLASSETLLEVRQKEKVEANNRLFDKLRSHPVTVETLNSFGGNIEDIQLSET